jgi:asparagine synthase (glutamine-hydrolysing)
MLAAQQIYGLHEERFDSYASVAFGRRLFRILPEDIHDRQPLQSRDGRLTLVADIRLDNRNELIAALEQRDDARCDADILLACLERWDEGALDRLVGDFAFALWDVRSQKLTLARDFLGQRPLHYHSGQGFFAFASMPKGLLALPEIPRVPDEQRVAEFLTLMPQHGPQSFYKNIARVEPAHILTVTRSGVSSRRYWRPGRSAAMGRGADDLIEGLRSHLDEAVQCRLRGSDGTVGAHLSAGIDSGAVTATAARLLAPANGKVVAFTAVPHAGYKGPVPSDRFGDEGPLAAATAAMFQNIEHVLIRSNGRSPLDGLDRNYFLFEAPILNLCNLAWLNAINQAARERKLNVMLTGQMGNMTVSYQGLELLPELLRAGRFIELYRQASHLVANTDMRWRGALAQTFGPFIPVWLWQRINQIYFGHAQDILNYSAIRAERLTDLDLNSIAEERNLDFSYRPFRDGFAMRLLAMQQFDPGNNNKGILGGWGIDRRDPLADKRLVEYSLSIPTEQFLVDGVPRALAKRALAGRLPKAVLNEQQKGYQAADWHEGVTAARAEIAAELERLSACAPAAKVVDTERLRNLVANWPQAGWERLEIRQPYRFALLRGISAGHFLRKALGANQ